MIAAGVLGAAAAVAFFATRGSTAPAAAATTAPAAPIAPRLHTITIDSMPQGAAVREGDKELGTTPMTLDIDPAAPQRRLVMSLEGYAPHTFLPTREDGRIQVPLAPLPAAQPATPPPADKGPDRTAKLPPHVVAPPPPVAPPARPIVPSDINTAR